MRSQGEIEGTLSQYTREGSDSLMTEWNGNAGDEFVKIDRTKVYCADSSNGFFTDKNIVIEIEGEVLKPVYGLIMGFWLYSQFDYQLAYSLFDDTDPSVDIRTQQPGKFKKQFIIPANTLAHGSYRVQFDFGIHNLKLIVQNKECDLEFSVENISGLGRKYLIDQKGFRSLFRPGWSTERF